MGKTISDQDKKNKTGGQILSDQDIQMIKKILSGKGSGGKTISDQDMNNAMGKAKGGKVKPKKMMGGKVKPKKMMGGKVAKKRMYGGSVKKSK